MEETQYRVIGEKLNLSIERLYTQNEELLIAIEKGLKNDCIKSPNVGYQGVLGSFSEEAAHNHFQEDYKEMIQYEEFQGVFEAINNGEIDYGVLPIENSYTGEILDVYDLVNKYNLHIVGEEIVRVKHNLVVLKGTKLEEVKEVYSHPQAFGQSMNFLKKHKHITCIPYANTAMASKYISEVGDKSKGAISSKRAAELYGLEVIESGINTKDNNSTRFIVLGKDMKICSKCDKVSIVFITKHTSGALYKVLSHFAYNGVNLLKIQSRPIEDKQWHYFFFVDLEGNLEDANMLIALGRINGECEYFKILGNYKGQSIQS